MAIDKNDSGFDKIFFALDDLMDKAESDTLLESRTIPEAETDVYPAVFQREVHADRFQRLVLEGATDLYKFLDIHSVTDDGMGFQEDEYEGELYFKVKKSTFEDNVLKQMDYTLEQALLHYFYSFWFAMIPQRPDISERYTGMYQALRTKIHRYTLHKKKATKQYRAY